MPDESNLVLKSHSPHGFDCGFGSSEIELAGVVRAARIRSKLPSGTPGNNRHERTVHGLFWLRLFLMLAWGLAASTIARPGGSASFRFRTNRSGPSSSGPASAGSFLVTAPGQAISYPVGVGRASKQWTGELYIISKRIKPAWSPPDEIRRDRPSLPAVIPAGAPSNPMGARRAGSGPRPVRNSRNECTLVDRRVRFLWLYPDAQPGHPGSVRARQRRNAGGGHPLGFHTKGSVSWPC